MVMMTITNQVSISMFQLRVGILEFWSYRDVSYLAQEISL